MKNTKPQIADEADVYRALVRAAERGEQEMEEIEPQLKLTKPPMSAGAYRLRQRLRHIDQ
ncbi:MAG: hypothetical protein WAK48_08495 [Candidatus Acidiferrum sp.]|jgi:hypothetical protein